MGYRDSICIYANYRELILYSFSIFTFYLVTISARALSRGAEIMRLKHVNSWQGNETLKTLVDHVTSTISEVLVSDAALAESLQDYGRYLYASLSIATALAPGASKHYVCRQSRILNAGYFWESQRIR